VVARDNLSDVVRYLVKTGKALPRSKLSFSYFMLMLFIIIDSFIQLVTFKDKRIFFFERTNSELVEEDVCSLNSGSKEIYCY